MTRESPRTIDDSILPHVAAIPLYVAGKSASTVAREYGIAPGAIIKLASNENPSGMAPQARMALAAAEGDVARYPDLDGVELRSKLAASLGLTNDQVILGAGSSELIQLAVRAVMGAGNAAVSSQYAFVLYESSVRSVGARTIVVPALEWGHDLPRMLDAIDAHVRIVFIASPNNPTGTMVDALALDRFMAAVPAHVLVILDEAYREFVELSLRPDVDSLVRRHRNLLVLRTFSKAYGLAGLRVGYGMGDPAVLGALRRLQIPFTVCVQGQAAAVAALDASDFVAATIATNRVERERLSAELDRHRFEHVKSHGNFILLRVGDGPKIFTQLLRFGVVIRPVTNYGLREWIRVTVGLPRENDVFMQHLTELLPNGSPTA